MKQDTADAKQSKTGDRISYKKQTRVSGDLFLEKKNDLCLFVCMWCCVCV